MIYRVPLGTVNSPLLESSSVVNSDKPRVWLWAFVLLMLPDIFTMFKVIVMSSGAVAP